MQYQEVLAAYKNAIKLRELKIDNNYQVLRGIFKEKIINSIALNAQAFIVPYLAGIKEVFSFVDSESEKIDLYKEQLESFFQENNI